jgi:hypothetical protein
MTADVQNRLDELEDLLLESIRRHDRDVEILAKHLDQRELDVTLLARYLNLALLRISYLEAREGIRMEHVVSIDELLGRRDRRIDSLEGRIDRRIDKLERHLTQGPERRLAPVTPPAAVQSRTVTQLPRRSDVRPHAVDADGVLHAMREIVTERATR